MQASKALSPGSVGNRPPVEISESNKSLFEGRWLFSFRGLLLLVAYGTIFTFLRSAAREWSSSEIFSLWFPAAGWRLAFLWKAGPRATLPAAIAELVCSVSFGGVDVGRNPLAILGVMGPCLAYGLAVWLVCRRESGSSTWDEDRLQAMPIVETIALGPLFACWPALLWALPVATVNGVVDGEKLFGALLVFVMGDMLGILLLTPPLLWVADRLKGQPLTFVMPMTARTAIECCAVYAASWGLVGLLYRHGYDLVLSPVLLAVCWIGLRAGRILTWCAILGAALIILNYTGSLADQVVNVRSHLLLLCIAVGGTFASNYADAEVQARRRLRRRDRMLLQAARLKTLRAMSLGAIHEAAQPLSTIALEAKSLERLSNDRKPDVDEIRKIASLIARKSDDLAKLMQRLRDFGESGAGGVHAVSVVGLLDTVRTMAMAGAGRSPAIRVAGGPDVSVLGGELELRQALFNLLRNALTASPDGVPVELGWRVRGDFVDITVINTVDDRRSTKAGLGVGLVITNTLAAAYGGSMTSGRDDDGRYRSVLSLRQAQVIA